MWVNILVLVKFCLRFSLGIRLYSASGKSVPPIALL